MSDANLYSDTFTVTQINREKYDRVLRLWANSDSQETSLSLDVNCELFPCTVGEKLQLLCSSTLSLDGSKDDAKGWRDIGHGEASLADDYDYVCHGKVYRVEEDNSENLSVI